MNKMSFYSGYMDKEAAMDPDMLKKILIGTGAVAGLGGLGYGAYQIGKGMKEKDLRVSKGNVLTNPVLNTVGRLSPALARKGGDERVKAILTPTDSEEYDEFIEKFKKKYARQNLAVNIDKQDYFKSVGRAWANPKNSLLQKILYPGIKPIINIGTALERSDHYDPMARTINTYTKAPGILAHELGHHESMKGDARKYDKSDEKKYKDLLKDPFTMIPEPTLDEEVRASQNASKIMSGLKVKNKKVEIDRLRKALETYLIGGGQEDPEFVLRSHNYRPEQKIK